ncbi:hypothetical protein ATY41_06305 [Leifsonia xyli subsp. xyli]|uniref:Membrane protein n=2 Tax=Leifsonia xyli subsp. xyli TaxID=59736 RepID=Q6ABW5_LEIXX|nr:DUF6049 family protein [Leifsonia xyli]AAT90127.1 membrane protein [Leifsonia xyli subsp. xyli str. CTCB07]ODA89329.1 hypothetical protein ATY41_06305 [Leifsonia xyli subsp. xyli]
MSESGTTFRGVRFVAVLMSAAVALSALLGGAPVSEASTGWGSVVSGERSATIRTAATARLSASLSAGTAGLLAPGQDLVASVTVTNSSGTALTSGTVRFWLNPTAFTSRRGLTAWLSSTDAVKDRVNLGSVALPALEPGASAIVRVPVAAAAVPFASRSVTGVFGVGAAVSADQQTAEARSSLVWSVGEAAAKTDVGVVMPIVSPSTGAGLISADDLATYTAPNGVLTRDLDGIAGHSTVAVGIDPMIVASIRALGNAAPATATDWLTHLSTLPNETFSLGYGDADMAGQLQAGLTTPLTPLSLRYALDAKNFSPAPTTIGEPTTATHVQPTPTASPAQSPSPSPTPLPTLPTLSELVAWDYSLSGIAWPGDGTLRSADLAPLSTAGMKTVIVSGDNTNADELDSTPNAVVHTASSMLAVSDQRISDALRQSVSAPSDIAWNTAMSAVNAQLALLSGEDKTSRKVLVALDRSWPSSGTQLQRSLDALLTSAWSAPAAFSSIVSASGSTDTVVVDAPESQRRIDAIRSLLTDEKALTDFATVLVDPTTLTGRTRAQLLTLLAVSWQNPRTDWSAAVTKSREATTKTLHAIRILPTENINLVSTQGSIPFTVSNELPGEAATVTLRASPSNGRLEIDGPTTKSIPKDSRGTMLVPVRAKVGNGQVVLSLQLYSPTGIPIGDPSAVSVEVHADWEGLGALVFGALLVLLFGYGIVRGLLRRRAQRRTEAQQTPEDDKGDNAAPRNDGSSDG